MKKPALDWRPFCDLMPPMKGWFIAGTDTGVGKTVLTTALLVALRRGGHAAVPAKPVHTGCPRRGHGLEAPDLDFALAAAGMKVSEDEAALMCPYRFEPACSPHWAAQQSGVVISIEKICDAMRSLTQRHNELLVEGAGGVRVPLNDRDTLLDLMRALDLPVIVAARPGLGTLNHTLLTLDALRHAGLRTDAIVLVESQNGTWGALEENNRNTLTSRTNLPVVRLSFDAGIAAGRPGTSAQEAAALLQPINDRSG